MPFDSNTRSRLARFVREARVAITDEFTQQFQAIYGISRSGEITPQEQLSHLDEAGRATATLLRERIAYLISSSPGEKNIEATAVSRLAREQAFTILNRLAAIRMGEKRRLILESVGKGTQSSGFRLFEKHAHSGLGEAYHRYRFYLFCLFDELAVDLGVLFDRHAPSSLLFPREPALLRLLELLNDRELDPLWEEDETIGWIYQYYNDEAERKKMREESAAPRNSRELAVRNQFFTPRYVVEFLTDNTLGRLWYEMRRGETSLRESCRYLIRRPTEIFLASPNEFDWPELRPWVSDVLQGNFTAAAEDATFNEISRVALCFDGYAAAQLAGYPELPDWADPKLTAIIRDKVPASGSFFELSLLLFKAQRNYLREHYQDDSPEIAEGVRTVYDAWRAAARAPASGLSQEDLLKEPVFIPHRPLKDPREIRLLDPACGSMHFGLYAFDLFAVIYDEAWEIARGPNTAARSANTFGSFTAFTAAFSDKEAFLREVPRLIVEHNLHGIDIDPRAAQIAGLSLWLRAHRAWQEGGVKPGERPRITRSNLVCAEPMPGEAELLHEFVERQFESGERPAFAFLLGKIFNCMTLAGEAGSLLRIEEEIRTAIADAKRLWKQDPKQEQVLLFSEPNETVRQEELRLDLSGITDEQFWERAEQRIYKALEAFAGQAEEGGGFQRRLFADDAAHGFAFIDLCTKRYDVAVMNPPFGDASLPSKGYIDETYGDTRGDVYKAFVECFHDRLLPAGYLGIISSRTGFFLSQSEDWRTRVVLRLFRPIALADLGMGVLDAMVEVAAYVLRSLSAPEARELTLGLVPVLEKVPRDAQDRFSLPKWQATRGGLKRHQAVDELEHLEAHGFVQRSAGESIRYSPVWQSVKKVESQAPAAYPSLVCIRALDGKEKAELLEAALTSFPRNGVFVCDPGGFSAVPTAPFSYWVSQSFRNLFRDLPPTQGHGRYACVTNPLGDNFRFVRTSWEVPPDSIGRGRRWVSFAKGGTFSRIYSDLHLLVDWDEMRQTYRGFVGTSHRPLARPASSNHFFRPGITWPSRADGLCFRLLPAGAVFSGKGPALLCDGDDSESLLAVCGILSSAAFTALISIQLGRVDLAQSFEVGLIQQTPFPDVGAIDAESLRRAVLKVWMEKRSQDSVVSTAHSFTLPSVIRSAGRNISERAAGWTRLARISEDTIAAAQAEIDDIAFRLYGLDAMDRTALATFTTGAKETEAGSDQEEEADLGNATALASDVMAYALGCVFGRWNVLLATGEEAAPEFSDPFAPLPICPPGQLQNAQGVPARPEDVPAAYPIRIPWDGILVDDPNHARDVERRVRETIEIIWSGPASSPRAGGSTPEAIEHEACEILGVKSLRDYFRKPTGFFADHLKRYSKSRRQAPIYWPLSTASGSYTLWIFYHRITSQTLHTAIADFLDPKIKAIEEEIAGVRQHTDGSGGKAGDLLEFQDELKALRAELERIIRLPWMPNLNDGVLITACPLWKLFRLGKWQNDLLTCWEELSAGDYDWAHLALSLWPERVREKCRKDRSLAIAHGLEDLCEVQAPKPKLKRAQKEEAPPSGDVELSLESEPSEPAPPVTNVEEEVPAETTSKSVKSARPTTIGEIDRGDILCLIRQNFSSGGPRDRETAIREVAAFLGYQRVGPKIREVLQADFLTAVRRGILANEGGLLSLVASSVRDYERDSMKVDFLSAIGRSWIEREEAIRLFARWLGYARVGPVIDETARSLINGLIRENRLQAEGTRIRRL